MKKINKKEICIFITLLIFILSQFMTKKVTNLDEIWNFNTARCMANGLIPYKDISLITGPLLPFIFAIFLKIFGQEMLVTRILAIILDTIFLFLIYKIMCKLKIKDYIKYLALICIAYIMREHFTFDYNFACLFVTLIIIYLDIEKDKDSWKKDLVIGILAGITITLKQTMGLVIAVATIGYKILEVRNLEDFKLFVKKALIRTAGVLIVGTIFIITLLSLGCFQDYIDYCILGVSTFTNKISYLKLIKNKDLVIRFLSIVPIISTISLMILYIKKQERQALILFVYSIITLVFVYPISDVEHFMLGIVVSIISIAYLLNLIHDKIKIPKKQEMFVGNFLLCFMFIIVFIILGYSIRDLKNENINFEIEHFKYLPIDEESINVIKEIDEFVLAQEKNVYILDANAALYMIPINRYNKNYDLFNVGNFGSKGEQGQIENLKKENDKIVLIRKNGISRNWQNPEEVRNFVKENMRKTGEIAIFDIYE